MPNVVLGLLFYPRGGSAQVVRYLARALDSATGWHPRLVVGSLGEPGDRGHAATFFEDIELHAASFDDAVASWQDGGDPMDAPFPMHPSYEPRANVPDRVLTDVTPEQGRHAVDAWQEHLETTGALEGASVAHLHHLTPLHGAVRQVDPDLPIVTHLHGTELKLLASIERGEVPGDQAVNAAWWRDEMRAWAAASTRVIVISPHDRDEAIRLLDLDPSIIRQMPNGVDVERFAPQPLKAEARTKLWQRWLIDDAQGWSEADQEPGSIRYTPADLEPFAAEPVLIYVGRFLGFKRVPLLVRAYARAREEHGIRAPLVIWGGAPGEWEGEHPHTVATELGIEGIYFAGWRGHEDLPLGLACSDVLVAPSTDEPFGQVYLEAMSCGIPVIGTQSGGPPSFVNVVDDEPDGWLVTPDDEGELTAAIVAAVTDEQLRRERGANARRHVVASYSWTGLAAGFGEIYDEAAATRSEP
jgi:glycosyltransferase involved in cell wall biosynthesis